MEGEFKPTEEELHNIAEAMKDEKFRKLLVEYAEEISNPDNRKVILRSKKFANCNIQ